MRATTAIVTFVLLFFQVLAAQPQAPALRIVVLEGEGGVNIIQQKTAVRPLVEVRDRNNVPVAGATVTFTIGGGGQSAAFAGGVQTLTVTTNAAGQAAASSLNAISSGAFQIQVQAAYQGQIATAAISQTNFATAAAAAQAGAGAGGGGGATGGATGGAAGGGGGISATTIGIVGAAVAGGAVAATQLVPKEEDPDAGLAIYSGTVNAQVSVNSSFTPTVGPVNLCTFVRTVTGTMSIGLRQDSTGGAAAELTISERLLSGNCNDGQAPRAFNWFREGAPVTGAPSAIAFTYANVTAILTETFRFSGSLSGSVISGTMTFEVVPSAGANPRYSGSASFPVTLTR
jgi:hypothetical protein